MRFVLDCGGVPHPHADAFFLDLRTPAVLLGDVHRCMKPGSTLACLLPTTNQVVELLEELEKRPFVDTQVEVSDSTPNIIMISPMLKMGAAVEKDKGKER